MNSGQQNGGHAYEPGKCESPIEREVAWILPKRLKRETVIEQQAWLVGADGKNYRADFLLKRQGRTIGIECDGKNWHNEARDAARDKAILLAGDVDAIYRFRGQDIHYRLDDLMYVLSISESGFFDDRTKTICETLASAEAREQVEWFSGLYGVSVHYHPEDEGGPQFELFICRRDLHWAHMAEAA